MSSFPDNFSATKSSSEGTKSRGEPVTRVMGFYPANFGLRMPFHSLLKSKHATDRQIDIHRHRVGVIIKSSEEKHCWKRPNQAEFSIG